MKENEHQEKAPVCQWVHQQRIGAKIVSQAKKLVEAGFEYICEFEVRKLFRKRK